MACFFSMPFSNNPYITPWGTLDPDGKPADQARPDERLYSDSFRRCQGNGYPYHVQPGDTLYSISMRLEVRLTDIIAANPGLDPHRLGIGQTICIPACPPDHFARYIQPGDTLAGLAREYNTSMESILEANPGIDPNYLRIGQRLCIIRHRLRPYAGMGFGGSAYGSWPNGGMKPENV